MAANFWEPGEGRHGLFDIWSFEGIDGVVSSGLGGGSLIYANVLLRKDEKWFVHERPLPGGGYEHWPICRADLEPALRRGRADDRHRALPVRRHAQDHALREAAEGRALR